MHALYAHAQYTITHYTRTCVAIYSPGSGWVCGMVTFDGRFICSFGIAVASSIAIPETVSLSCFQF